MNLNKKSCSRKFQTSCMEHFSVAEPHYFYAAPDPAPGKNFDAAPAAPQGKIFKMNSSLNTS
jgi:hypothetical protein